MILGKQTVEKSENHSYMDWTTGMYICLLFQSLLHSFTHQSSLKPQKSLSAPAMSCACFALPKNRSPQHIIVVLPFSYKRACRLIDDLGEKESVNKAHE
jgi:hypothetical protein